MNRKELGKIGEDFALNYFRKEGYEILEKNFKIKLGEIDLIAKKKDLLVFIEVKTRKSLDFGDPVEGVDKKKQERIKLIANVYLSRLKIKSFQVRFDVFSIILDRENKILFWEHIPNAF